MGPITRTATLAIIFEISIVLPVAGTEELADTPPPLAIQIGEHGAADFVNLIFLFDRVATQSSSVTSPDYRERISQPSSPFYPDYLEYRSGRIDRRELVRRLPHVSMIGDSLSLNFLYRHRGACFGEQEPNVAKTGSSTRIPPRKASSASTNDCSSSLRWWRQNTAALELWSRPAARRKDCAEKSSGRAISPGRRVEL